jgi:hypothetical protein
MRGSANTVAGPSLGIRYATAVGLGLTPKVNLEELARELGCMEPWEALEKSMTKPDPYHLFRPIQYLDLADQFYSAFHELRERPPPFSWPRYFLLCHSIELALKAYLAKLGATLEQLKWDFGH